MLIFNMFELEIDNKNNSVSSKIDVFVCLFFQSFNYNIIFQQLLFSDLIRHEDDSIKKSGYSFEYSLESWGKKVKMNFIF